MKIASKSAAQGDVMFRLVGKLPINAVVIPPDPSGRIVVAHSETGHHHAIDSMHVKMLQAPSDPLVCYLQFDNEFSGDGVDVVHHRTWDTHETIRLLGKPGEIWEVRRQREWSPEGWRRVED